MRIDGGTEPATRIDEETGAIVIRRLHPRIACYNDVVMFLVKANMDIKHIGSGEAAKALLYYVTDYITKASLSTHVGLAALLCAIQRTDARFGESFYADAERNTRSALMTTVNSMLSRMEISHQQVMSYLVGGGDHYASHRFRVLHYGGFDRLVDRVDDPTRANAGAIDGEESGDGGDDSDEILLLLGEGSIGAVSQQQDYIMRSEDGPFDGMSLYEYVGMAEKITKRSESTRMARRQQQDAVLGRRAEARGAFLPEHAQYETHMLRKRASWVVPVVLSNRVPRKDRGAEEREAWARMMLVLFVPWRHPRDLKGESETWTRAYERREGEISKDCARIVDNMNVLEECRDARDAMRAKVAVTEAGALGDLSNGHEENQGVEDALRVGSRRHDALEEYYEELDGFDPGSMGVERGGGQTLESTIDADLGYRVRSVLDRCYIQYFGEFDVGVTGSAREMSEGAEHVVAAEAAIMKSLKKKRRGGEIEEVARKRRRGEHTEPYTDLAQLDSEEGPVPGRPARVASTDHDALWGAIAQVIHERRLDQNLDQLRAFEIVARHVCFGTSQLLMYIGGVGGTGKTYVVEAILRLYELLGR
ncbi:hypothetical protein C8Q73DRAFT_619981, partial [Cubamyces lactineus]